jgi:hypothetical protein
MVPASSDKTDLPSLRAPVVGPESGHSSTNLNCHFSRQDFLCSFDRLEPSMLNGAVRFLHSTGSTVRV